MTIGATVLPASSQQPGEHKTKRFERAGRFGTSMALNGPSAILLVMLILAPIVIMAWSSLTPASAGHSFSLATYEKIFSNPLYLSVLLKTMVYAVIAAAVTVLVSWPAAWTLSRLKPKVRNPLLAIIIVPYLTSYLLLIYSMFMVIGPGSPLTTLLQFIGIVPAGTSLLYTPAATILMLIYESLAVTLFILFAVSERVDRSQLEAAASLGAGRISRFRKVILPLSVPGLVSAFLLVFVTTGGAFAESDILGGPSGSLSGNVIAYQLNAAGNESMASALSILLLFAILLIVGVVVGCMAAARKVRA